MSSKLLGNVLKSMDSVTVDSELEKMQEHPHTNAAVPLTRIDLYHKVLKDKNSKHTKYTKYWYGKLAEESCEFATAATEFFTVNQCGLSSRKTSEQIQLHLIEELTDTLACLENLDLVEKVEFSNGFTAQVMAFKIFKQWRVILRSRAHSKKLEEEFQELANLFKNMKKYEDWLKASNAVDDFNRHAAMEFNLVGEE